MNWEEWLSNYVYSNTREIFFVEFPTILTEWLSRLMLQKRCFQEGHHRVWTPKLMQILMGVNNKKSHVVDYWLDSILGRYVIVFVVDTKKSYSTAKR